MIPGFEEITQDLSLEERSLVRVLVDLLQTTCRMDAPTLFEPQRKMTNKQLRTLLKTSTGKSISDARFRKLISIIRGKAILPVIADRHGYWISYNHEEILSSIMSLSARVNSMIWSIDGMKQFLTKHN